MSVWSRRFHIFPLKHVLFSCCPCKYAARIVGSSKDTGKVSEEPTCTGLWEGIMALPHTASSGMTDPKSFLLCIRRGQNTTLILQNMKVGLGSMYASQLMVLDDFWQVTFTLCVSDLPSLTCLQRCNCFWQIVFCFMFMFHKELQFCFESEIY